jgi:hypothetical protein
MVSGGAAVNSLLYFCVDVVFCALCGVPAHTTQHLPSYFHSVTGVFGLQQGKVISIDLWKPNIYASGKSTMVQIYRDWELCLVSGTPVISDLECNHSVTDNSWKMLRERRTDFFVLCAGMCGRANAMTTLDDWVLIDSRLTQVPGN